MTTEKLGKPEQRAYNKNVRAMDNKQQETQDIMLSGRWVENGYAETTLSLLTLMTDSLAERLQ